MENIFKYILFPILIVSLLYLIWKNFFGDPTKLEVDNSRLLKNIENLERQKDSIESIKKRLEVRYDSIYKVGIRLDSMIKKDREKIKIQEYKLKMSVDTLNIYKKRWKIDRKKIEEMKKNQRIPTNEETFDFFKKY
jgi:hypothetical protein